LDANKGKRPETVDLSAGAKDLPPGWKSTIDAAWAVWRKTPVDVDPSLAGGPVSENDARLSLAKQRLAAEWGLAKQSWLGLGPGAENLLAENLIRWYILAFDASNGYEVNRAREEMVSMKPAVRPYLVQGLATSRGDSVTRSRLAELLGYLGGGLKDVVSSYERADDKGQMELARALKAMKDPESIPFLMEIAESRDPWQARADALTTLGILAAEEAAPVFVHCLKDSDSSVRKFAAMHAGSLGSSSSDLTSALVRTLEDEDKAQGNREIARAAAASLQRITGKRLGADAAAWRAYLAGRGD
jgi:hypothetical protein